MKIASTPLAASARAVSSAVSPAPTTSTRRSSSSPSVRWASSTATEGIDSERSEIPVSDARPLAGRERGAEEPVEDRAGRALDQRQLVGALDLALDLGLADDHRVEPAVTRNSCSAASAPRSE